MKKHVILRALAKDLLSKSSARSFGYILRMTVCCLCAVLLATHVFAADVLEQGFASPPDEAKPRTWWHWVNGNISKEGITADLEAMKRVGVGGAQILNVAPGNPAGPVKFESPQWWDMMRHAARECDRLGLELTIADCAGWSESGGTWVTPEQSMQKLVWSQRIVSGPSKFSGTLDQPPTIREFYRDVKVLAFPTPAGDESTMKDAKPAVTASSDQSNAGNVTDGKSNTLLQIDAATAEKPQWIQLEFPKPFTARLFTIAREGNNNPTAQLETSDDGQNWKMACNVPFGRGAGTSIPFPQVTAKSFRLYMTQVSRPQEKVQFDEITLSNEWRLDQWQAKAGFVSAFVDEKITNAPPDVCIAKDRIVDLSDRMSNDGKLEWDVPAGSWTILRLGHTSTGKTISPAPPEAVGLECDKMSREAVQAHFDAHVAKIAKDFGELTGKSFQNVLLDSWEARSQNWTPAFLDEFNKRRGYDATLYLPAMTGRVVENAEVTERFLWDVRRTIGDLIAENHYGLIQELCHKMGLKVQAEAPGINLPTIAEAFQCKEKTDITMGEFWVGKNAATYELDCKEASSAAHIQGVKWASAESFTASNTVSKWTNDPYSLKAIGDLHFTAGINRYVFHRYAHQPWLDRVPGQTMGPWGIHFERTETWWEPGAAWLKYIARCQYMLSQGTFVADFVYYYGQDVPNRLNWRAVPAGYDFDGCGTDALMRMSVKQGRIFLPSGMSYRALVLADKQTMTPPVAQKIRDLIKAGAKVIGPKPTRSPSLSGYPANDQEVQAATSGGWASEKIEIDVPPDFESDLGKIAYIHRRTDDAEIYFVSNQLDKSEQANCTFRVDGKAPELWHPDTGVIEQCGAYTRNAGRTTLPLQLDPAGSVFVVFRKPAGRSIASVDPPVPVVVSQQGKLQLVASRSRTYAITTASGATDSIDVRLPGPLTISGAWEVRFPSGWDAPSSATFDRLASWTENTDEGIKYFSGTATYVKQIELKQPQTNQQVWLDLGEVKNLAQVKVNGKDLGVLWKPPFAVEITSAMTPGSNTLEISVTNLWPNRLIGDERLPEDKRHTWAGWKHYSKDSPLLPSGLLGPVVIKTAQKVEIPVSPSK